ncbi:MAG: FkbM family methyltransferase [Ruminococcaceae bacterium]|nr:FkbM family methyltransferase [Oscillospiraceae bacterium]
MDLWQTLANTNRPILLYGMGNGADKIVQRLAQHGASVADFFASDGFVRGQLFHGKPVLSRTEALSRYPDAIVLLAFGSARDEVLDAINEIRATHTLLVPDVPVFGDNLFTKEFYTENEASFTAARDLLGDERSKVLFDDLVRFKLSGDPSHLWDTQSLSDTITECLHPADYRFCLDLGAYVGDTAEMMLGLCPQVTRIDAWEPDPKTFVKLTRFADSHPTVHPIRSASLDYTGQVDFAVSGNRNAGIDAPGKVAPVSCTAIDDRYLEDPPDFIKIDVEGAERPTLIGAAETLRCHRPDLLISLYHRSEDLYDLPLLLHSICPDYKLSLRRDKGLPAWDIVLTATCCATE